jgi:hypothetical protein
MQTNPNMRFGDSLVFASKIELLKSKLKSIGSLEGDLCEVGVYKGGTAKIISQNMNHSDKLFLFDTFEGIPNRSNNDNIHIVGDFNDCSYEEAVNFFKNAEVYKGIFPEETSDIVKDRKFKFVHLDVDTYLSYKSCLEFFYNRMTKGGIIMFDDYGVLTCQGATVAVDEFFSDKPEKVIGDKKRIYDCEETAYIIKE